MNTPLTNRQIAFVVYCTMVGFGIINLPRDMAEAGGTGGWIPLVILTVVFMFNVYIISYLGYVNHGKTLIEYSEKLVGEFLTRIISIIYGIYFFMFFTFITRIYAETVRMTMLPRTPSWVITFVFFLLLYYSLSKGLNVIVRVCEMYGFINIVGNIFMSIIIFTQGEIINIRPLFVEEDLMLYLSGTSKLIFAFLGVELLFMIPFNKEKNSKIFKYTPAIVGITGAMYILIGESAISIGGIELVTLYKASVFNIIRGLDVSYLEIFRRLDGIYVVVWSLNIICSLSLWGYGVQQCINKGMNIKESKLVIALLVLAACIIAQIPESTNDVEKLLKYNGYLGYITSLSLPLILLIITKVKKYDKKTV
ncbi:spore germination protein YndE [Clostridium homopropionicum DSM 5847]|uniref:Spore germination protein YndE n=1 Tax=Clostridium homopropionicum DSM 5847 TaxID=1121318 RepID=A0A0L6Z7P8_9CLOT|nr:GerAB/ArcD/ProY family transporter [Clostridium homopropionicum]KOA18823.1 spore germination protein YndE [Clostridium homopropionicum DSM 5847]SFG89626.1 spore germination protein [Clostridium homopropionicum]